MSHAMRRDLMREATGPTKAEFAAGGATFLVGMITPYSGSRLMPQYAMTPVDSEYTRFQYLDALPTLVGGFAPMMGSIFNSEKRGASAATRMFMAQDKQRLKAARQQKRQLNRTTAASEALINWFEKNGGEVISIWTAPGNGSGFTFSAEDEFTIQALQQKARQIARDPRYNAYQTVVPGAEDGEYLVAFVREPRLIPIDYITAVNLADAATDDEIAPQIQFHGTPDMLQAEPLTDEAAAGFFDKVFGPKKAEGIQKKIEKLKKQLAYWEEKLAEAGGAPAAGGVVIGNIMSRFRSAEDQEYGDAYQDGMFHAASDVDYGDMDLPLFDEEDGAGMFFGAPLTAASTSSSTSSKGGGRRKKRRRIRRRMKSRMKARRGGGKRRRKSGGRGGGGRGGGGGQQQPQIIIIREGGGGGDEGGEDDYDDDYEDDSEGFYDIGLSMGRVKDLPRSPHGYNINYPVG